MCLLIGEPGVETPAPGSDEFSQMLSDYESAAAAMVLLGVIGAAVQQAALLAGRLQAAARAPRGPEWPASVSNVLR